MLAELTYLQLNQSQLLQADDAIASVSQLFLAREGGVVSPANVFL